MTILVLKQKSIRGGKQLQKHTPSILRGFQDQMQEWWLQSRQRDHKRHKGFGEEHSRVLKCYLWDSAGPPYSNELVGEAPVTGCHDGWTVLTEGRHRQSGPTSWSRDVSVDLPGPCRRFRTKVGVGGAGCPSPTTDPLG